MKNLLTIKIGKIILPLILLALSLWAGKGLFKYSVYSTHDGLHHISRSYDVIETLKEGHFPLRWAGSLNYGCGVPIYNFFYPLYYYLVAFINPIFTNVVLSLKIISLLSLIVGTLFFYLWIYQETKNKLSAFGGALLYLFAPYRFSLILVRGSPEFLAYTILPIVLFFYALAFNNTKTKRFPVYLFCASLSGGFLTISHNFTVMFLMPIILGYLILKVVLVKKVGLPKTLLTGFSYISIFGLGAFFVFPALIEQKYTQIGLNAFIVYKEHFPTLWQLFKSKWGYFYSAGGTEFDGMSFMLGYAQWFVLVIFIAWFLVFVRRLLKKRRFDSGSLWILLLGLGSVFMIFMMLEKSIFIWDAIPMLTEIQFPWRLLGIAVFMISALLSFLIANIKKRRLSVIILATASVLAIAGNRNHLLPMPISEEDIWMFQDYEKYHHHRYSTTTMADDIIAREAKGRCWFTDPEISFSGEKVDYQVVEKKNTHGTIRFDNPVKKDVGKDYVFRLGYFPGAYSLILNGSDVSPQNCEGRVCIPSDKVRSGYNVISWKIVQTPTEKLFNMVSLGTLFLWILLLLINHLGLYKDKKKLLAFILTAGITLIFCFFRFYKLPKKFGFDWDAERDAFMIKNILSGRLTLIGPRVLGPSGFFLPPYFYYILAPFYFLSKLDPRALLIFLYSYNVIFLAVSISVLSRVFSKKVALLFIGFWAIAPYTISMDTVVWNPIAIPLVFVIFIYLVNRYIVSRRAGFLFLSALFFSLGVSFHVQFLVYGLFYLPLLAKILPDLRKTALLILGLILPFVPLFLFDVRHGFINTKLILEMFTGGIVRDNFQIVYVWSNYLTRLLLVNFNNQGAIVFYLVLLVFLALYVYMKKRNSSIWKGMLLVWILFPLFFYLYGKRPSEYYFNFLTPVFIIFTASFISDLLGNRNVVGKLLGVLILLLMGWRCFPFAFSHAKYIDAKSYFNKERVVRLLWSITEKSPPFNVSYTVPLGEDVGFRYMVDYFKIPYSGKSQDTLIQLTYPSDAGKDNFVSGVYGIKVPGTWLDESLRLK